MYQVGLCQYCLNEVGDWREEEGYIGPHCLRIREEQTRAEREKYEGEEAETCNCFE